MLSSVQPRYDLQELLSCLGLCTEGWGWGGSCLFTLQPSLLLPIPRHKGVALTMSTALSLDDLADTSYFHFANKGTEQRKLMQKAEVKFKSKPGRLASEFLFCWGCPVDIVPIMPSTDSTDSDNREQETFSPSDSPPSKLNSPWNGPPRMDSPGVPHTKRCALGLRKKTYLAGEGFVRRSGHGPEAWGSTSSKASL